MERMSRVRRLCPSCPNGRAKDRTASRAERVEAGRRGVQQDAADELAGRQRHGFPAVLRAVVLPAEADTAIG